VNANNKMKAYSALLDIRDKFDHIPEGHTIYTNWINCDGAALQIRGYEKQISPDTVTLSYEFRIKPKEEKSMNECNCSKETSYDIKEYLVGNCPVFIKCHDDKYVCTRYVTSFELGYGAGNWEVDIRDNGGERYTVKTFNSKEKANSFLKALIEAI
jgi:hypothetical protein